MRKSWYIAICVSIIAHLFLCIALPGLRVNIKQAREPNPLKIFPEKEDIPVQVPEAKHIGMEEVSFNRPPPFIDELIERAILDKTDDFFLSKAPVASLSKELSFSETDLIEKSVELQKIPAYMDYYNNIREKIREKAYVYYEQTVQGVVYISFIILKDGKLYHLNLLDKSTANDDLLQLALKSIKAAAPFPPFPQDLDYPKLHFNVSIHFKSN